MQVLRQYSSVVRWLYVIATMVFAMVLIGGITRLTDSGLSIVNWRPIMGVIPPITDVEWLKVFNQYKAFPEFKLIKFSMNLSEFKAIYFWEYFHRVFGRLIGMAFLFPYIYFKVMKSIPAKQHLNLIILFTLGGLQGLLGWYMVKSGLISRPDVSQYRLAAHLGLAFLIIGYTIWTILSINYPKYKISLYSKIKFKNLSLLFFVILCFQIFFGALVAGLDAGLTHNTFPKMGSSWVPFSINLLGMTKISNIFENPVYVQFIHRVFAWILLLMGLVIYFFSRKADNYLQKRSMQYVVIGVFFQFILGVITLLSFISVPIASLHQVGACILMLLSVRFLYFTFHTKTH